MIDTHADVSVVIVAFKSAAEIRGCIASLPQRIGERAVEVVVVDNSADDETAQVIRSAGRNAHYIPRPDNPGFGRANNVGYRVSRGEIVLFLNPDTICNGEALEHCVARLQEDPSIGLISPRLALADGSIDPACRRSIPTLWDGFCRATGLAARFPKVKLFSGYNLTHLPEDGTYDVGAINGAFMMGRREVFEKVGVFDERFFVYGDDLDLCIRVAKAGYRIVYDGRVQITHLKGTSVAKDYDRMSRAIFDANRDVYLKHFNPRNSRLVEWKYHAAFGLWKWIALTKARIRGYRRVRPL